MRRTRSWFRWERRGWAGRCGWERVGGALTPPAQRPGAGDPRHGLHAANAWGVDAQRDQPRVRRHASGAPAAADLRQRQLELEATVLSWLEKTMRTLVLEVPDDQAEALEREAARL